MMGIDQKIFQKKTIHPFYTIKILSEITQEKNKKRRLEHLGPIAIDRTKKISSGFSS
jgi:hypothetical protein